MCEASMGMGPVVKLETSPITNCIEFAVDQNFWQVDYVRLDGNCSQAHAQGDHL